MAGWLDGWMAGWLDSWMAGWLVLIQSLFYLLALSRAKDGWLAYAVFLRRTWLANMPVLSA